MKEKISKKNSKTVHLYSTLQNIFMEIFENILRLGNSKGISYQWKNEKAVNLPPIYHA